MSTMTAPEKTWNDEHHDPGPTDAARPNPKSAARSVLAAIRTGALPDLPSALTALPDALARVGQFELAVLTGAQPENSQQMVARYAAALATGDDAPDPAAFAADVHSAAQVGANADAVPYTLASIRRKTEETVATTLTNHADTLLDSIRAQVGATLTEARAATRDLAGMDHTDPAAVAGATEAQRAALRTLATLATRYNRARKLQRDVLVATGAPVGQTPSSPDTFGWTDTFTLGIHEHSRANFADHGPDTTLPPVARMVALATRPDVWVPTREQLEHRWTELHNPQAARKTEQDETAPRVKITDKRRASITTA